MRLFAFFNALLAGFCLGISKREYLHLFNEIYYDNANSFHDEEYNRQGLRNWERKVINEYFQQAKYVLIAGVGGGREILALRKLGYVVDGFDCNPGLVVCANRMLNDEGFLPNIDCIPPDQCSESATIYDGILIGWGAYAHIPGRDSRIEFLRKLRVRTREGCPILLSFFSRSGAEARFRVVTIVGNAVRRLLRMRDSLELGDDLFHFMSAHFFTKEEIESELCAGGFRLKFYSTVGEGHAVGVACDGC